MKTQRVWGIFYRVRSSSQSKWGAWVGPCGVNILPLLIQEDVKETLQGRPFFFRTRKPARNMVIKLNEKRNITWSWVQYIVRPVKLTYEVLP